MITLIAADNAFTFDESVPFRPKGRFGWVYKGTDAEGREVIVKKLAKTQDPAVIARFRNEWELRAEHPAIVKALAYVKQDDDHFIIREFVEGHDLKNIPQKKRSPGFACAVATEILHALAALHRQGIIHRDLKPANVLVNGHEKPFVKLIDLGLAKRKSDPDPGSPFALIYSSPEQLLRYDELVDETSDLYALGIVLYEVLTGTTPFYHHNPELLMNLQLTQPLQPHKNIPAPLYHILQKATVKYRFPKPPSLYSRDEIKDLLASSQQLRFQSANEMLDALAQVPESSLKPRPWWKFFS